MHLFSFFRKKAAFPVLSFGVTVCNEEEELRKLLHQLLSQKKEEDQIIILQDVTNPHQGVSDLIEQYAEQIVHVKARLDGDFSTFKNNLIEHATGDYLFQIDADELLTDSLTDQIYTYLQKNSYYDCFSVPRINIVRNITPGHLAKWRWSQNKNGYINYPDYQMRLFKLKDRKIRWINKVHEVLTGYKSVKKLPAKDYSFCLIHDKQLQKQEEQNKFYKENFKKKKGLLNFN